MGALKLSARLWTLYIAHIAVFIIVCGVVAAAVTRTQNPLYLEAINIQPFFNDTFDAVVNALTLRYQPNYLDILPLYIVLLGLFPLVYFAVRISPLEALGLSLVIWQVAICWASISRVPARRAGSSTPSPGRSPSSSAW